MTDDQYISRAIDILRNRPTAADLDFLVQAFHVVGNLAADAEGLAEGAEAQRKFAEAQHYLNAKVGAAGQRRMTEREAEAVALTEVYPERLLEVEARTKARKLRNLLGSLEQAINAQKYLGRLA